MSIPNLLAVTRLILTPVTMWLILKSPDHSGFTAAAAIVFAVAALTDFADGYLARRWRITTTLGAFLDTVADKVLITGALIALVQIGTTDSWVVFIIVGREIAVMGLRSVAALDQGTVPPSLWGKWKATVQFVAIIVAIVNPPLAVGPVSVADVALWTAVVVTVVSAGDYFSRFRGVLSRRERDE
jgi:CDP-diacylglycerol---glycerol-3-phosphate 3-phosphatidyltransferase